MQTFLVGGAVRDRILGLDNDDLDYVIVGATPEEVEALGYSAVGSDFPVYLAPNGDQYALARKERKAGRGYGGFAVEFDPSISLEDDLSRRDLTINAIAVNVETDEIHDPFNGLRDIREKVLRHVSDAFAEDPLRVIRLARFAARFSDFTIAPNTLIMCKMIVQSGELDSISNERFVLEMEKMFNQAADPFIFFNVLWQTGAINCKFFVDFLGTVNSAVLETIKKACDMTLIQSPGGQHRLEIFASYGPDDSAKMELSAIPNSLKWFRLQMKTVKAIKNARDGAAVMDLLKNVRAFNSANSSIFELISMMEIGERQGVKFTISSKVLRACIIAAREVDASNYIADSLTGAELGKALFAERLKRVTDIVVTADKVKG